MGSNWRQIHTERYTNTPITCGGVSHIAIHRIGLLIMKSDRLEWPHIHTGMKVKM